MDFLTITRKLNIILSLVVQIVVVAIVSTKLIFMFLAERINKFVYKNQLMNLSISALNIILRILYKEIYFKPDYNKRINRYNE